LNEIKDNIEMMKEGSDYYWRLSVNKLIFRYTDKIRNSRPSNIKNICIVMNITLAGKVNTNNGTVNCVEYLNDMKIDIEIVGIDQDKERHLACWHIDKHLNTEGDNSPIGIHPMFHIHFGGQKLQSQIDESGHYGNLLLLDSPRIQFPPLDVPLSIDFIISNFYGDYHREIINDKMYRSVIKESQANYWKPYYHSISSIWERQFPVCIDPVLLIPCLIK